MNITPIGIRGPGRTSAPAQIRGNGQSSASRYVINGLLPITAEALKSKTVREHHINILVANYGKLPDNHITINYLTDLAKKRVPSFDKKIIVLPNHPEANAFVTLDKGTIFVTQKLINKLGCVQALSFILGHENLHLVEDHAANGSGVGERRVQETRADFLGTKDIHDMGENPLGAIEAMDSLDPKHEASGPIHGASIDRSLNMLMTVPHIDLPNLSHQLDPIPQRIKNSGINPPLAERVCRMSISDIAPMVWSCNFYQLRVMLEAIEEDEIKTLFCENKGVGSQDTVEAKKALLIARARELVCRELIRQKIDQSYADVVLAFYLESIGVEAEIKPDYSKEELTWLSENFIKFAKRSSIGLEPLAKDSARSYCESFATLFSYVVSDNVEDYISLNIKATESVRDVLGSDSPKFLLNPAVSELFAQNLLGDLKREFIKRGRPIRDAKKVIIFDAGEEFLFNPQYDFNLVLPLLMRSNCFDISYDLLGRFMVFVNNLEPGMRSLLFECPYSYYLSKDVKEFDAIRSGQLKKVEMSDERIRELDREFDQRVRKTPYLSFYINSFFPDASDNVKQIMAMEISGVNNNIGYYLNISGASLDDLRQLKSFYDLSLTVTLVGLKGVFWGTKNTGYSIDDPYGGTEGDNWFNLYREKILTGLASASSMMREKISLILSLGYRGYEGGAEVILGYRFKNCSDINFKMSFADIIEFENLYLNSRTDKKNDIRSLSSTRYSSLVLRVIMKLLEKKISLKKKVELLRRLPSFASCHWSLKLEREERKVLLDFVRSNASLAKSFDDKLTLSFLIPDPLERYQLQRALLFSEAEKLGFDAAIKLLDRHKDLPEVVLSPSISYFVDQLPRSKEEHSQAMAFLQERLKEKGGDSAAIGGMAVLDHILFEKLSDTGGLLKAALASATDEETFKNYFFNLWMSRFHPDILKYSPFSNQSAVRNWIQDLDEAIDPDFEVDISKPSLAFIIDLLYSLDSFGREILLRRCLVGKEGLLMQKEGSRKMIDDFLENRVDSTNQDRLSDTIKRALYALVETAELKQIYLLLAPILKDNFLVPPEEHFSFHELAKKKAIEFVDSQMDNYRARIINGDVDWNSLALYLEKLIDKKSPLLDELKKMEPVDQWLAVAREKTIDEVSQKLVNLIFGRVVDVSIFAPYSAVARRDIPKSAGLKWDEVENMRQERRSHQAQVEEQLKKEAASVSYFELFGVKKESRSFSAKLDPIEVVSEGGRILLPVGVRILQCLRQYIDLPDDLAVAFEKLMDSVVGQTRPTLFSTFKREAGADQVNQDFFDEVKVIGERIGGGSLVTVHEVELGETDNKEVLKVSNPNAIYRAEEAVQILRKVVDHMAENDPENRMTYLAIQMLLDDVLEWIVRDVNDERFYGNDEKVFDRYNGYDNGGVYSVLIPKHRFLSGPYLQAEELIEGHNLTKVRIDGEDSKSDDCLMVSREEYKDIICLYSQMFLDMVLEGRALSNLTPGNVRVAPGKKLAILDRRLYLELNDQDLGFLKGLYHSFSKPDQLAAEIVDYVQSLTQNKSKKINGLRDGLEGILKDSDGNWESALFNSLVLIRKHRLKIPLRLTLLIMNLKVLSNLSKRAGFDNLLATLMHRPNQELFAKLLQ